MGILQPAFQQKKQPFRVAFDHKNNLNLLLHHTDIFGFVSLRDVD